MIEAGVSPERKTFSKIRSFMDLPNLIDVQRRSYERFLQKVHLQESLVGAALHVDQIRKIHERTDLGKSLSLGGHARLNHSVKLPLARRTLRPSQLRTKTLGRREPQRLLDLILSRGSQGAAETSKTRAWIRPIT